MKTEHIDYLNIGLIFLSLALAMYLPFELFLFSYAVLGPLHYLTEINWLKGKDFFIHKRKDAVVLLLISVVLVSMIIPFELESIGALPDSLAGIKAWLAEDGRAANLFSYVIAFALILSVALSAVKERYQQILILSGGILYLMVMPDITKHYNIYLGVFLPTVIHVCLFTGAFMLYGALKGSSKAGYASFGCFVLVLIYLLGFYDPGNLTRPVTQYVADSMNASNFTGVNRRIAQFFYGIEYESSRDFFSSKGMQIQVFLSFIYTYHYLNWFSKTSIIKWHKVSKTNFVVILTLWAASVGLYAFDYKIGFIALLFLSFLHVLLEFPLNYTSFVGIGQELKKRISGR